MEDLDALAESLKGASNALVIGGGAIGLEAAIALNHYVTETTLLEMRDQLLPGVLDADMSEHGGKASEERNIRCRTGTAVEEILGTERLGGVKTGDGEMKADVCVLAAGFRASTELASASGLTLGNLGIAVDSHLRTSDADIYAAGDCIEARFGDGREGHLRQAGHGSVPPGNPGRGQRLRGGTGVPGNGRDLRDEARRARGRGERVQHGDGVA